MNVSPALSYGERSTPLTAPRQRRKIASQKAERLLVVRTVRTIGVFPLNLQSYARARTCSSEKREESEGIDSVSEPTKKPPHEQGLERVRDSEHSAV